MNWLIYIWAVLNERVVAATLGYFLAPLANVALGVAFLGERISRVQWLAIAVAAAGIVVLAIAGGGELWMSLLIAASFSLYGLVRKMVRISALGGLTVETLLLSPAAVGLLLWSSATGTSAWGQSARLDLLLFLVGAATAGPLLLFAAAARRLRYSTVGFLQFITPTITFAEAVLLFGEPVWTAQIVTFALIWCGCVLYALDSLRKRATSTVV